MGAFCPYHSTIIQSIGFQMNHTIKLSFMENTEFWCNAWCIALSVGATVEQANIAATLAQYAYRDLSKD